VSAAASTDPRTRLKRVLVVRTSAIGDIVFASPIASALRRTFPDAHIAWLVEAGLEELIASDPAIDEVIAWPRREWTQRHRDRDYLGLLAAVRAFRRSLRARRFDTALDLQGLFKSGLLARLSGAKHRIGLGSREGSQLLMTRVIERGGPIERISSEYLHFAQALGLDAAEFVPTLFASPQHAARAQALLSESGLDGRDYAVFAPFTTRPQKHWFDDAWAGLTRMVVAEQIQPVVLGGPADRAGAAQLVKHIPDAVNLVGRTSLGEAAALIQRARLVIGVDTGLTHMGLAFKRPTVALFGSTRPYLDTCHPNAEVIWLGLPCSPCRRRPTCRGAFTCLRDIAPEQVMAAVRRVLAVPAFP